MWNQQSYHDSTNFPGAQPDIDIVYWSRSKVFSINGTFGYFQELEVRLLQSREQDIEAEAIRWFSSNRMECWWLGELDDSEVCIFEGILRIWGIVYICLSWIIERISKCSKRQLCDFVFVLVRFHLVSFEREMVQRMNRFCKNWVPGWWIAQLHVQYLVIWSCDPGFSQHFSNFLRKLWSFWPLVVDSTEPG